MNAPKSNLNLERSPINQGVRAVLWLAFGVVVLTLCVGLPILYLVD